MIYNIVMNINEVRDLLLPNSLSKLDLQPFATILEKVHTMARPHFLAMMNTLARFIADDECYLEVGSYQGGSLIGTLLNNSARAISVDNFSEFQGTNNLDLLTQHAHEFGVYDRVTFRNMDFHEYFKTMAVPALGMYYYDGAHDALNTQEGLELGFPYVVKDGLIILDDTLYPDVVLGLNRFLGAHPAGIKVLYAASPALEFHPGWWNGTIVLQKTSGGLIWPDRG